MYAKPIALRHRFLRSLSQSLSVYVNEPCKSSTDVHALCRGNSAVQYYTRVPIVERMYEVTSCSIVNETGKIKTKFENSCLKFRVLFSRVDFKCNTFGNLCRCTHYVQVTCIFWCATFISFRKRKNYWFVLILFIDLKINQWVIV